MPILRRFRRVRMIVDIVDVIFAFGEGRAGGGKDWAEQQQWRGRSR